MEQKTSVIIKGKKTASQPIQSEFSLPLGEKFLLTELPSSGSALLNEDPYSILEDKPNKYFPVLSVLKKVFSEYPSVINGRISFERIPYIKDALDGFTDYNTLHDMFIADLAKMYSESREFLLQENFPVMVDGVSTFQFTDVLPYSTSLLSATDLVVRPVNPTNPISALSAAFGLTKIWTINGFGREVYRNAVIASMSYFYHNYAAGNALGPIPIKVMKDSHVPDLATLLYGYGFMCDSALGIAPAVFVPVPNVPGIRAGAQFLNYRANLTPVLQPIFTDIFLSMVGGFKPTTSLTVTSKTSFLGIAPVVPPRDLNMIGSLPVTQADAQQLLNVAFNTGLAKALGMTVVIDDLFSSFDSLSIRELIDIFVALAVMPPNILDSGVFRNLFRMFSSRVLAIAAPPGLVMAAVRGVQMPNPVAGVANSTHFYNALIHCVYSRNAAALQLLDVQVQPLPNGPTPGAVYNRTWHRANLAIEGGIFRGTNHAAMGLAIQANTPVVRSSEQMCALAAMLHYLPLNIPQQGALRMQGVKQYCQSLLSAMSLGTIQVKRIIDVAISSRLSFMPYNVFPVNMIYPVSIPKNGVSLLVSEIDIPIVAKDKTNVLSNVKLAEHFRKFMCASYLTDQRLQMVTLSNGEPWERSELNLSSSRIARYIASVASTLTGSENVFGTALVRLVSRATFAQTQITYPQITTFVRAVTVEYAPTNFEDWIIANGYTRLMYGPYNPVVSNVLGSVVIHNVSGRAFAWPTIGLNVPIPRALLGVKFNLFVSNSFSEPSLFPRDARLPATIVNYEQLTKFVGQKMPETIVTVNNVAVIAGANTNINGTKLPIGTIVLYNDVPPLAVAATAVIRQALAGNFMFTTEYALPVAGVINVFSLTNKGIERINDFYNLFEIQSNPYTFV